MEFRDPSSSSSYYHRQPPLPHLYDSQATHHLNLHQPPPAYTSASYPNPNPNPNANPNPNPNPNPYPSFENSLPIPSTFASAAAASDAIRPPAVDPYPHAPYAYSYLPYNGAGAGAHSIPSQSYPDPTADYYYQHPPPPHQHQYGVDSFAYEVVGSGNPAVDLETKRRKVIAGGAPPDSVRICTICNVVCNSDKVFALHLAGEKHALKAFGIPSNPLKLRTPTYKKVLHSTNRATHPAKKRAPKTAIKQASKGVVTFIHSTYCDVCKIDCQSQEVLSNHKLGRKHKKNLQKLQESVTPKPANAPAKVVTTNANTSANQSKAMNEQLQKNNGPAAIEDLEMKKQKVLSGGAAADAVRVCTCCNVVCNNELVYNFHIAGKKHASVVKKQQQQQAAPAKVVTTNANTNANQCKTGNEQLQKNNGPAAIEDLETKKQKVLSGGAAADAVRVCTWCNVVCNSELVYNIHVAGKKHAAVVKQEQQQQQEEAALVS